MSSRMKKSRQQTPDVSSTKKTRQQTPEPSTSFTSPGRNRPPSPVMIARVQEKQTLASLNDRLAAYIDRVRQLETDNSRLVRQVQTQEETVTREVSNIKSLYETELSDARRLLDETAKQKAKLQIEVGKYKADAAEFREKYTAKERELKTAESRLHGAEAQVNDLQARLNDAVNQRKQWESECNKLRKQVDALEKQLATAKKQLEEETILRVDLENRLQSLKEELAFSRQIHSQELNESRMRTTVEVEEVDSRLQVDYEARLAEALQQMREENDAQIKATRDEAETYFQRKLSQLKAMAMAKDGTSESARKELNESRRRIEELESQLLKVSGQIAQNEARVRELEALLKRDRAEHEDALNMRDLEIRRLREAIEDQMTEYRDLLDIKIQLDLELVAYRKLLEGEESRLNITIEGTPGKTPHRSTPLGRKRKRMTVTHQGGGDYSHLQSSSSSAFNATSSATGAVEISEVDPAGQFIKIHNTSDKDVPVGSWQLKHIAKDEETTYKYHRSIQIKAGAIITVWSSESDQTHSPPSDLVMKGQKWFVADNMRTVLLNNQGDEVATREMERSMQRRSTYTSGLGEDIVDSGYEGDPTREDRCTLM